MQTNQVPFIHRHQHRQLLIENKLTFNGPETELSIYDTYQQAERVSLAADQLLYCGMVTGTKVMHNPYHTAGKLFLPHESYVLPPGEQVEIDFPDASEDNPTTCLTIEISQQRVESIAQRMQDINKSVVLNYEWQYQPKILHTHHTQDTQHLLEKMVKLFLHNEPDKEIMVDLGVSELITRILREQGREVLLRYCHQTPDASGITAAVTFLEQNISQVINIDVLCRKACMSRSRLYVEFRKQLGCTPGEFHQQLRLTAAAAAIRTGLSITEACYSFGFNDLSHFSRRFSQFFGCSPSAYRKNVK